MQDLYTLKIGTPVDFGEHKGIITDLEPDEGWVKFISEGIEYKVDGIKLMASNYEPVCIKF